MIKDGTTISYPKFARAKYLLSYWHIMFHVYLKFHFFSLEGMFFQWMMCNASLFVGVFVNIFAGCPQFHPLAMLGGVLWATGKSTRACLSIRRVGHSKDFYYRFGYIINADTVTSVSSNREGNSRG